MTSFGSLEITNTKYFSVMLGVHFMTCLALMRFQLQFHWKLKLHLSENVRYELYETFKDKVRKSKVKWETEANIQGWRQMGKGGIMPTPCRGRLAPRLKNFLISSEALYYVLYYKVWNG